MIHIVHILAFFFLISELYILLFAKKKNRNVNRNSKQQTNQTSLPPTRNTFTQARSFYSWRTENSLITLRYKVSNSAAEAIYINWSIILIFLIIFFFPFYIFITTLHAHHYRLLNFIVLDWYPGYNNISIYKCLPCFLPFDPKIQSNPKPMSVLVSAASYAMYINWYK